jgi:hypothetical protein
MIGLPGLSILHPAGDLLMAQEIAGRSAVPDIFYAEKVQIERSSLFSDREKTCSFPGTDRLTVNYAMIQWQSGVKRPPSPLHILSSAHSIPVPR